MEIKQYNIAIIGATGNVGREIIEIMHQRDIPVENLYLVASEKSFGQKMDFGNKKLTVDTIDYLDFEKVDIFLGACGSEGSKTFVEKATQMKKIVIDEASIFRTDRQIPLIVPEINEEEIENYKNKFIISSPNCCAIPIAMVLKPLDDFANIKRVVVSTYQSVSGAGRRAMDELFTNASSILMEGSGEMNIEYLPKQIAFNVIPQIGDFDKNGSTSEEIKIANEVGKLLKKNINMNVTSVRVPVFIGHSFSVNVEFENKISKDRAEGILGSIKGISVIDDENYLKYVTPLETAGEDNVFVSRIREDSSQKNTLSLWIVCDNLKKGAALNMVQILEKLINIYI